MAKTEAEFTDLSNTTKTEDANASPIKGTIQITLFSDGKPAEAKFEGEGITGLDLQHAYRRMMLAYNGWKNERFRRAEVKKKEAKSDV